MQSKIFTKILIIILVIIYLALFLLIIINNRWSDGDEVHYLLVSSSILRDGDLVLDNNYENKDYFEHHSHEESPHAFSGRNEELRPAHGILTSIIMVPGYGLSIVAKKLTGFESNGHFLFFPRLTMLILHIFFGFILIKFLQAQNINKNMSLLCVILYSLQLPIIIYSQSIYSDLLSAYFIMTSIAGIIIFLQNKNFRWLTASGIFLGLTIFMHSKLIILTLLIIIISFIMFHTKFRKDLNLKATDRAKNNLYRKIILSLLIPWLIFLTGNIAVKFYWFGTFYFDGVRGIGKENFLLTLIKNPVRGWLGQWLDIEMGMIPNAPLLILIFTGLFIWFRNNKQTFLLTVPPVILYLFLGASTKFWSGGFCPPGRHILISIPVLLPALGWVIYSSKKIIWLRWLTGVTAFLSLLLSSLIPFTGRRGLPYSDGYNIYWRKILGFIKLDSLNSPVTLDFFNPKIQDYFTGICIFIIFMGIGYYLIRRKSDNNTLKKS
jgi:hypothetical protein